MLVQLIYFFVSALAIYAACEYFVNAVEWCGRGLRMGALAVGSVLAAFGTALPESIVTLMAVVGGRTEAERQLGVGAALGGPLVLSTIAYAVVGVTLLLCRGSKAAIPIPPGKSGVRRDQLLFMLLFAANLALGLTSFAGKRWLALGFVVAYLLYVLRRVKDSGALVVAEDLEPLRLHPAHPSLGWAALQALGALAVITVASKIFVAQLGAIGVGLHLPPQLVALLLSPVATELPETMNAVIWVRQGKLRLALANISGSMMIQATIPTALGIFFTRWRFDRPLLISALVTMAAIAFLAALFAGRAVRGWALVAVSGLYMVFGGTVAEYLAHRWEHVPAADHARLNPWAGWPGAIDEGRAVYEHRCASCHATGKAPVLLGGRLRKTTDGDVEWFLRQGDAGDGMPSLAGLAESERWKVIRYLRSRQ
jgi:cation:H+ antiporter